MGARQLYEGAHLPSVRGLHKRHGEAAARTHKGQRPRRYTINLPKTTSKRWTASSTTAMRTVFGTDALGAMATTLFQSATATRTDQNYSSNLVSFFAFCDESFLEPLKVSPVDIARFVVWMGQRGTVAAASLQPYLSAINKFLQEHALPPVAVGPLVARVRKGLENCQEDMAPLPQRLPLPAPVALQILELAEGLQLAVEFHTRDPDLPLLRAAVAIITSYTFFNRGECGANALRGDIVVEGEFLTLLLINGK